MAHVLFEWQVEAKRNCRMEQIYAHSVKRIFWLLTIPVMVWPNFAHGVTIYATDGQGNRVVTIQQNGQPATSATAGLNIPTSLAFDRKGNLYVSTFGTNSIEKFTPAGVGSVYAHVD